MNNTVWVKYSLDLRLDIKGLCSSLQPQKKSLHLRANLIYLYTLADIKELVNLDSNLEHLEDLPAPLLPENLDEKQKPNFQDQSFGANQTTLEDYLSVSDNMSLLSLDMSGQNMSDQSGEQDSLIFYR